MRQPVSPSTPGSSAWRSSTVGVPPPAASPAPAPAVRRVPGAFACSVLANSAAVSADSPSSSVTSIERPSGSRWSWSSSAPIATSRRVKPSTAATRRAGSALRFTPFSGLVSTRAQPGACQGWSKSEAASSMRRFRRSRPASGQLSGSRICTGSFGGADRSLASAASASGRRESEATKRSPST